MYQPKFQQYSFENFHLPFQGKLDPNNRWIRMAEIIPWPEAENVYAGKFPSKKGAPALSVRMALGSLIIKEKLGLSDQETVDQIKENPYLQYFIGLERYQNEAPFDASMLTWFRKRIEYSDLDTVQEKLRLMLVAKEKEQERQKNKKAKEESNDKNDTDDEPPADAEPKNQGKLIVDATCAPADIAYPTDLGLLNDAREKSEKIIDKLHAHTPKKVKKPRTYRQKARKDFLKLSMKRNVSKKHRERGNGKQLQYLNRNLKSIGALSSSVSLQVLEPYWYRTLLVITELYRQQQQMHQSGQKRIDDRIVSISQPHVRPIVRGKASAKTEFGMKLSISVVNGWSTVERMSWKNYNEGCNLKQDIERYHVRYGYYPESVHADKIYRTQDNRNWCKERGIRLSGIPLGRPPKDAEKNRARQKQIREDEGIRNGVEGKFGEAKRRYGLKRIMAKLSGTSQTTVSIIFLVMNLQRMLSVLFAYFRVLRYSWAQYRRYSRFYAPAEHSFALSAC